MYWFTFFSLRAMLHNETFYPDPFEFNPDRFMKDGNYNNDVKDPAHATFGFGRRYGVLWFLRRGGCINDIIYNPYCRQCPGRHMAQESVWLAVSSIIAAFDISKSVDENGNVIEPTHEYLQSLIWCVGTRPRITFYLIFISSMPLPFTCSINPRSEEIERLIRASSHD
jgi:hypothetical protein